MGRGDFSAHNEVSQLHRLWEQAIGDENYEAAQQYNDAAQVIKTDDKDSEWDGVEVSLHGYPRRDIVAVQAEHDQLVMAWEQARREASPGAMTDEFLRVDAALTQLIQNNMEILYPEVTQN